MSSRIVQEQRPFDVAWRAVDGLRIRYATDGSGDEKVVLFSPWPESIYAFAPVWGGLTKHFEVWAIDLPGFGQSEARDDLFAPQKMGEFIAKAFDAFGLTPVHAVGLDVGSPSVLFAVLERPELFRSLIVGAGASTYPLVGLASIKVPVKIVVGRNDPYGLARDAALLRERLPHARLDVLEAGHCVWEERAPEFESIVTQWVNGGFQDRRSP